MTGSGRSYKRLPRVLLKSPRAQLKTAPGGGLEDGCALFCREATVSVVCVETMNYAASNQVALRDRASARFSSFIVACTHLVARKLPRARRRAGAGVWLMERLDTTGLPCVVVWT